MKLNKFLILVLLSISIYGYSQVPYFGPTCGKGRLYTYAQYKYVPLNSHYFYVSSQYGILDNLDISMSYNSNGNLISPGIKYTPLNHKNIQIGIQPTIDFDLSDGMKFKYANLGLYLTGQIYKGLTYISNTWMTVDREGKLVFDQWTYLYYDAKVTPVIGALTDLSNKGKTDLALGLWFTTKPITWYVWCANVCNIRGIPRLIIGIDYKL